MTTHIATSVAELLTLTHTGPDEFRGPSPGKPDWIYGGQVAAHAWARRVRSGQAPWMAGSGSRPEGAVP